ncbi:hypothetical protein [Nocardioides cavernaquae]|uniref:Uncharacterized protein n=1 Tax=Nocardioides cavernaquae TaxID=2321396 RepID=A0A3A5H6X6_9ACTN|nr:hypothetical protein [Nocardioides cavernaquae]RJS46393.1 hypothetical protein D4739_09325 [Nocardioides cavernaquae]
MGNHDTTAALTELERALGTPVPDAFAALGSADAEHLTAAIRTAQARQGAQLEGAVTDALNHVPRPLRGAVRKAVGL